MSLSQGRAGSGERSPVSVRGPRICFVGDTRVVSEPSTRNKSCFSTSPRLQTQSTKYEGRRKNRQSKNAREKTTVFLPGVLALVPVCVCLFLCLSRVVRALFCRCLPRRLPCLLLFSGCSFLGGRRPEIRQRHLWYLLAAASPSARFYRGFLAVAYDAAACHGGLTIIARVLEVPQTQFIDRGSDITGSLRDKFFPTESRHDV